MGGSDPRFRHAGYFIDQPYGIETTRQGRSRTYLQTVISS